MLEIEIRLNRHGRGKKVKTLCTMTIVNDGTGSQSRGNYDIAISSADGRVFCKGRVENWPRRQHHVIDLVRTAILAAHERNEL